MDTIKDNDIPGVHSVRVRTWTSQERKSTKEMRCGAYVCYLIRKGEPYTIENETTIYEAEHKVR